MTLGDIERLCWSLSGWQVEQRSVDTLLSAVRAYTAEAGRGGQDGVTGAPGSPARATVTDESVLADFVAQGGVQGPDLEGTYVLTVSRVVSPGRPRRIKVQRNPPLDVNTSGDMGVSGETERTCRLCGHTYRIEKFSRDKSSPGGRKTACTPCENIRRRDQRRARRQRETEAGGGVEKV